MTGFRANALMLGSGSEAEVDTDRFAEGESETVGETERGWLG